MELLVVIAIIGVLIALILPAVQKVRAASLRIECLNHLKQIGLAAHQYHNTAGSFPAGMRSQNGKDPYRLLSWLAQLLPYIEQDNLWQATVQAYRQTTNPFQNPPHVGLATVIPTFGCPTDGRSFQTGIGQVDKFPVAFTSYLGVEGKDVKTLDGVLFRDSHTRIADITDGTSQTLLAGERPPSTNNQYGWWYAGAGQNFTGSADMILGVEEQNILPITSGSCPPGTYTFEPGSITNQCDMFHFWSLHPGGANFLFADGSVHFLSYSVAPILPALGSRAGGETASSWE
jgi:prepilin-type processing-associated H-X9-DG protein